MFKGMPAALAFIALPTFANPQFVTEIEAGDIWIKGGFFQADSTVKLSNPSTGESLKIDNTSDSLGVSSLIALDSDSGLTPILGFSVEHEDDGDDKVKLFGASVGFVKKTASQKNIGMLFSYTNSENADDTRSSFDLGAGFQTSGVESENYNELAFSFEIPKDEGDIKGGKSLKITNKFKLRVNETVDFIALGGIKFIANKEFEEDDFTLEYDPVFAFGGVVAVNLDPQFSLNFHLSKTFTEATYNYSSGDTLEASVDATHVGVDILARF